MHMFCCSLVGDRRLRDRHRLIALALWFIAAAALAPAHAGDGDCDLHWDHDVFSPNEMNGPVRALIVYDDGGGERLIAGGDFTSAGGVSVNRIAAWDGKTWAPLGEGFNARVWSLIIFDDGSGPALYAAGEFTMSGSTPLARVARWDGREWHPLGEGLSDTVRALAVYDSGNGPELYAGGLFSGVGGVNSWSIARWTGKSWANLFNGITGHSTPMVEALAVYDDGLGDGPKLFITGNFTLAGGSPVNRIAWWDGEAFGTIPGGLSWYGRELYVYDDGSGPVLCVGGSFNSVGNNVPANFIATWNGKEWSALGDGLSTHCRTIYAYDDGEGYNLYAGGNFIFAEGQYVGRIARWNGEQWLPMGIGVNDIVRTLCTYDDGNGESLFVGGLFTLVNNQPAGRIACWRGCTVDDPTGEPADLNEDGVVNVFDLLLLLSQWGECDGGGACPADLNGDSQVNVFDLLILLTAWG